MKQNTYFTLLFLHTKLAVCCWTLSFFIFAAIYYIERPHQACTADSIATSSSSSSIWVEEREGGRTESERARARERPNHWPDTFFVKAITVRAVDDVFVVVFLFSSYSFRLLLAGFWQQQNAFSSASMRSKRTERKNSNMNDLELGSAAAQWFTIVMLERGWVTHKSDPLSPEDLHKSHTHTHKKATFFLHFVTALYRRLTSRQSNFRRHNFPCKKETLSTPPQCATERNKKGKSHNIFLLFPYQPRAVQNTHVITTKHHT